MGRRRKFVALVVMFGFAMLVGMPMASADGTETLGDPSIEISTGSGVVMAGTGLFSQPGTVDLEVPADATINQVLLYWNGFHSNEDTGFDGNININGAAVDGTLIGGPTFFFGGKPSNRNVSSTYRADITGLGLVSSGANSLSIDGLEFDRRNNGAGVLVIFDDGSTSEISIVDGTDLAFFDYNDPRDLTVPQTFTFAAEGVERVASLGMFFSSVEGEDLMTDRPSVIRITVDGVVTELIDALSSSEGAEWDNVNTSVTIPAGVSEVTVQAFSEDINNTGNQPASLSWNTAALSVPVTPVVTENPSIDIEKYINHRDADDAPGPRFARGTRARFRYVVTNTGDVPLTNVTVTDSVHGDITCPQDTLEVGETFTCKMRKRLRTIGEFSMIGTVNGESPAGTIVTDEDPVHFRVRNPRGGGIC